MISRFVDWYLKLSTKKAFAISVIAIMIGCGMIAVSIVSISRSLLSCQ